MPRRRATRSAFRNCLDTTADPENDRLAQLRVAVQLVGQHFVYLFVALHIAGNLRHGVIKRDGVLKRMLLRLRRNS
jgi:cytochrome b561